MAVEMIGGPRLCEPLLATGLGRFTGAASRHANGPRKRTSPHWRSGWVSGASQRATTNSLGTTSQPCALGLLLSLSRSGDVGRDEPDIRRFLNSTASIITDIAEGGPSRRLSNVARRLYFARSQIIWFVAPVGVRITRSPAPNTYARTTSSPTCPGLTLALRW